MSKTLTLAGAGSGKTYKVEHATADKLLDDNISPANLMVVTFTVKAAEELKERITGHLIDQGHYDLAAGIEEARLGTINCVCGEIVRTFCFELGRSPQQRVVDDPESERVLSEALDSCLSVDKIKELNRLECRFSLDSWSAEVLDIVKQARVNRIAADALSNSAQLSINELESLLPPTDDSVTEARVRQLLESAIHECNQLQAPSAKIKESMTKMERIVRRPELTWQNWVQLSKLKAARKDGCILDDLNSFGGKVLSSPVFRQEMHQLIFALFDTAASVMSTYDALKAERGLVDFTDQELLLLNALERPDVAERLKEELQFLVVDEFQDTSPIQLALFAKLSDLADETLFVGDTKQAIYGFRGTDSTLSLDVLKYFQGGAGNVSALDSSWRSRPGLVHFINALFERPFSPILTPDQVTLIPQRINKSDSSELAWWQVNGKNKTERSSALASGVRELIDSSLMIEDKESKVVQPASYKDVAILCRSNGEVSDIASALTKEGIPVASSRAGLLETPEVSLVLACFRRLIDPSDSLASAEILTLLTGKNPENWLESRFNALGSNENLWNDNAHPVLEKLASVRAKAVVQSVAETLSLAIHTTGILEIIASWGEEQRLTDHRLANIQKLRDLISEYEDHCLASGEPGTAGGFLLWLKNLEQSFSDSQAENPGNAVKVLTYHASKGLEWPVVICCSLNNGLKVSLTGVRTINHSGSFSWNAPLDGRQIRYWPDPFPNQKGNDPLTEILQTTELWSKAEAAELQERLQLLYVGMTRACDHLVLTNEGRTPVGAWLQELQSDLLPPSDIVSLPSGEIRVDVRRLEASQETVSGVTRSRYWPDVIDPGLIEPGLYHHQPSSEVSSAAATARVVEDFKERILVPSKVAMNELGDAIHHSLALLFMNPELTESDIQQVLDSHLPGLLKAESIVRQFQNLKQWIDKNYPGATIMTEVPVHRNLRSGALQQGRIDLLLKHKDRFILIDHKSNPQPRSRWEEIALEHSGQLKAYSDALSSISGVDEIKQYIFFAIAGGLVEVSH